jgi:superfamily II DNA or RNA helicase
MPLVTTEQPEFTGAMSAYPWTYQLEQLFAFQTKYGEPVNMAHREGNLLYAPREVVPVGKQDYRRSYKPVAINCNFEPRNEEQATLPYKSAQLLAKGQNHIFNAPTGWGKSVAGGVIACLMGQPTMIVVNKTDLMDSWYDALVNVLGIPPSQVGKVQQDTCNWQGKRIVIGMAHSLCIDDRYDPEMFKYFGLLIVDEVHQMAPSFFSKVFRLFPAKYRLGFSATTDRKDGMWRVLTSNIGPVMIRGTILPMTPKILTRQTGWRIPRNTRWVNGEKIEEPIPYAPGRMGLVTKCMASSNARNMHIVEFTQAAYEKGRRTLILSDLIDNHLKILFNLLTSWGIPGNHIGYYVGGMTKHDRELSANAHVILGTYAMVMTGTNVPIWDTLVFGTPRSDIRQALGRILRSMSGKNEPVALDLVDYDKIYQNFYLSRVTQYYGVGAKIVPMSPERKAK